MARVYNFSAGPGTLPESVLNEAAGELAEYKNSGMSVMEMSHRSNDFINIFNEAESTLKEIMKIPDNYKVLFLQGGASSQFAMVPLNLFNKSKSCDLVHTGNWTKKALSEAKKYGEVNIIADSEDKNFSYIPDLDRNKFNPNADYFYICSNNTIYGTRYSDIPDTGAVPLVSDMSSCILSEEIDVNQYGIIFAGAQKNIGPAGLTIVIIREDLAGNAMDITPTIFNYETHIKNNSMFNTPPTYCIYFSMLVFKAIKKMGGIREIEKINKEKSSLLYDFLDNSSMFSSTVNQKDRSLMNVPFKSDSEDLDKKFIDEAKANGLVTLKGHRSVGGMRASIYNAMPMEGVQKLVDFLKKFEIDNR